MSMLKVMLQLILSILLLASPGWSRADEKVAVLAPGYGELQFPAPLAGTYRLDVLGQAGDGKVLSSDNEALDLHSLMGEKIVLLSFIYSTCRDVNGCPLATAVFYKIKNQLRKQPETAQQLRLITLSFDPEHDTPELMRAYGKGFQDADVDWHFITTDNEKTLQPILDSYRQSIQKQYDLQGQFTGTYAHLLRVFLIDTQRRIRNIYSVSFLHPETLINDVKTLLMEREDKEANNGIGWSSQESKRYQAGDYKENYQSSDYQTRSVALSERKGSPADLLEFYHHPGLGLPSVPVPKDNPVTRKKIALGRKLFYDRRLSLNNTFSCAICHIPEQGFTSQEMATAVGVEGRSVRRNSMSIYNVGYFTRLFHDGREQSLEQQVWGPLLARNEMANPSVGYVINKIKHLEDYAGLFEAAFARGPTMETVGMAIASYERTMNAANSAFDRWYYGQQQDAINSAAKRGFALFTGKAQCAACHTIERETALFTDNLMHNTGLGFYTSMLKQPATQQVLLAPGISVSVDSGVIDSVSEKTPNDLGLYEITQNPADRWKYKTPSLRNIALTAPYMHNGAFTTLREVIQFYNRGGVIHEGLDPLLKPLSLSEKESDELLEFLQSLNSDRIQRIVSDAYAAPIGEAE